MNHRVITPIVTLVALIAGMVASPVQTATAIEPFVLQVTSDCHSVQIETAMVYTHDDGHGLDHFMIIILDAATSAVFGAPTGAIGQAQSPTMIRTALIPGTPVDGTYLIDVWDTDETGKLIRRLDRVFYQCLTGASWRDVSVIEDDPEVPDPKCLAWIPVHAVNAVPEDGTVLAVWTYGKAPTDPHYFVAAFKVVRGQPFDMMVDAPCGVYLKLYFQPGIGSTLYFLESQYHPGDLYGTPPFPSIGPSYHMAFPAITPPPAPPIQ